MKIQLLLQHNVRHTLFASHTANPTSLSNNSWTTYLDSCVLDGFGMVTGCREAGEEAKACASHGLDHHGTRTSWKLAELFVLKFFLQSVYSTSFFSRASFCVPTASTHWKAAEVSCSGAPPTRESHEVDETFPHVTVRRNHTVVGRHRRSLACLTHTP